VETKQLSFNNYKKNYNFSCWN